MNLEGARGILVNITAGENLSLGEFAEVGEIIEDFASDDATVVIGTAIEHCLKDEMRVTVVATGLGSAHARPTKVVDNTQSTDAFRKGVSTERRESAVIDRARASNVVGGDSEMDYLDIPAFLRRQAD